jgi:hypothetical protein
MHDYSLSKTDAAAASLRAAVAGLERIEREFNNKRTVLPSNR